MKSVLHSFCIGMILLTGLAARLYAQPRIVGLVARPQPDKILLRWTPDSSALWQKANQYGYFVERRAVWRNGAPLTGTTFAALNTQPLRPAAESQWTTYPQDSLNHRTLYEALYAPDPAQPPVDTITGVVPDAADLFYYRYVMALLAADQSFSAARLAALGYIDATAQSNERYEYRITTAIPTGEMTVQSQIVTVGIADYSPLLPPVKPSLRFSQQLAVLGWAADTTATGYNSYWVERSENGSTYARIHPLPFLAAGDQNNSFTYQDSLPKGRKTYHYRLRARTIFDEIAVSSAVLGQSKNEVVAAPAIKDVRIQPNGSVRIDWQFPGDTLIAGADTLLRAYFIGVANRAGDAPIAAQINLPPTSHSAVVSNYLSKAPVGPSYYFTVAAVRLDGDTLYSSPVFTEPLDTIPPTVPTGLQGTVGPQGFVSLNWRTNAEPDLLGYKVFRSQRENEEASSITGDSILVTATWRDTLDLNFLNAGIYYRIKAIDRRYNESALSAPLRLNRPDTLRPTKPLFISFSPLVTGVRLRWANSSSRDVVRHTLYRQQAGSSGWQTVAVFAQGDTAYTDGQAAASMSYRYLLMAQDAGGLVSDSSAVLLVDMPASRGVQKPVFAVLNAQVNPDRRAVTLTWSYDAPDISEYQFYRAAGSQALGLWRMMAGLETSVDDEDVQTNTTYRYSARAVFRDGTASNWKEVTLTYRDTITTAVNQPPYVAVPIPVQKATIGQAFSYTAPGTTFADPETGALTQRILAAGLPTGLTATAGTLSGTPQQAGEYTITVEATDARGASGSTTFKLQVNGAPSVVTTLKPLIVTVGQSFTYTVPSESFYDYGGSLASVTVLPSGLPAGLTVNGAVISGALTAPGPFTLVVQATDNEGAITQANLQLTGNRLPVVVTAPANQTATIGQVYSYSVAPSMFRDDDGQLVSVSIPPDSLPAGLSTSGSLLKGVPTTAGSFPVVIQATDNQGAVKEARWTLSVVEASNTSPTVAATLAALTVTAGESMTYTVPTGTFFDLDGQITTIAISGSIPAGLTTQGGRLQGTPTTLSTANLTVTATDNRGVTVSTPLVVNIIANPAIPSPPTLAGSTSICSGQSATLTASGCPGTVIWNTGATGASLTVSPNATTTYTATCTANGFTSSASLGATVTIKANPVVTAGSNSPIQAGQTLQLTATNLTGGSYQWVGPNGFTAAVREPSIPSATTATQGSYTVTATVNGCSTSSVTSVTVSPATSFSLCIEAEDNTLTSGTGSLFSDANASGGKRIGSYGSTTQYRQFTVNNVPITGQYQLKIRYYRVFSTVVTAGVLVNQGTAQNVSMTRPASPPYYNEAILTITLNQGTNTIRIQYSSGSLNFDLDRICIISL